MCPLKSTGACSLFLPRSLSRVLDPRTSLASLHTISVDKMKRSKSPSHILYFSSHDLIVFRVSTLYCSCLIMCSFFMILPSSFRIMRGFFSLSPSFSHNIIISVFYPLLCVHACVSTPFGALSDCTLTLVCLVCLT